MVSITAFRDGIEQVIERRTSAISAGLNHRIKKYSQYFMLMKILTIADLLT
jgi:hypothetical protein